MKTAIQSRKTSRFILTSTIMPAVLVGAAMGVDVFIPPSLVINSDSAAPVFSEGLKEGKLTVADDEVTVNPENSSPELTLRMGQLNQNPGGGQIPDGWGNPATWIYTGQIRITSSFLAFAMNNDDTDWLKINGVIVLDDNGWNTPIQANAAGAGNNMNAPTGLPANHNLVEGLGLIPGQWYDFEVRVSDTGAGGAGPSGQGTGWSGTYGIGMNTTGFRADGFTPLGDSVNGADYIQPVEPGGGGPTLFRFLSGFGLTDDLVVTADGTLTINGAGASVVESSLRFQNPAPVTLTVNDGVDGGGTLVHKKLSFSGLTQWATVTSGNTTVTLMGSSDIEPGEMRDNGQTVTVRYAGTGSLILSSAAFDDIFNTTFSAVSGLISVRGNSDVVLGAKFSIDDVLGTLRFGGGGTFSNPITVNASGTLEHTDTTTDNLTGAVNTTAAVLNTRVTAGTLALSGTVSGSGINKTGAGTLVVSQAVTVDAVTVNEGVVRALNNANINNITVNGGNLQLQNFTSSDTVVVNGGAVNVASTGSLNATTITVNAGAVKSLGPASFTTVNVVGGRLETQSDIALTNQPNLTGGTLALRGTTPFIFLPTPFVIPGGNVEIIPGALGTDGGANPNPVMLSGGMLTLDAVHGLTGRIYNQGPNNTAATTGGNYNADWGPETLGAGDGNFTSFSNLYTNLENGGAPRVTFNTSINGVTHFNFPSVNTAPFAVFGVPYADNIQARFHGQFYAPVTGTYSFGTTSDDGSVIFVNGQSVVYNNRYQGMTRRNGSIPLTAGLHNIEIGFYEGGGGAGLIVHYTPPGGTETFLDNATLFPTATAPVFNNPVTVTTTGGIHVQAFGASIENLTSLDASSLAITGNPLKVSQYTFSGASATLNVSNETTVFAVSDGGAAITLTKTGSGDLIFDDPAVPQFQNAASLINVNGGAIGVVLGGSNSGTGNAALAFNGGGVVLSSKDGLNKSYAAPDFANGGVLGARQIGSGLAGAPGSPITVTITGNLNVNPGSTLKMSTADNYMMNLGGTATGGGTVEIGRGVINATTNGALQGQHIVMNPIPGGDSATLNLQGNATTLASLATQGRGTSTVVVGNGLGAATLTLSGPAAPGSANFGGSIMENGGETVKLILNGSGTQVFSGVNTYTGGIEINGGTVEFAVNGAQGTGDIILNGGTVQFSNPGLALTVYSSNPGTSGAYGGILNTINGVFQHYAGLGTPETTALTTEDGQTVLSYNPGGGAEVPFAIHGSAIADNIEAIFVGRFNAPVAGTYNFDPRSDDGTNIFIDGNLIVNNNFPQGIGHVSRAANVVLSQGFHDIVITFNEGVGGAGMYVNYTPPGGTAQLLPNFTSNGALLSNTNFSGANQLVVSADSTLDLRSGVVSLGALTQVPGTTLEITAGRMTFGTANFATGGTFTFDGAGALILGQINDAAAAVTLVRDGGGDLILGSPSSPQLQNNTSVLRAVNNSRIVAVGGGFHAPLGLASVEINGGTLALSTSTGFATFNNTVSVIGSGAISAGNFGGGGVNGPATTSLQQPVSVGAGNTLTVSSANQYTLGFDAGISGGGSVSMTGGLVTSGQAVNLGGDILVSGGTFTGAAGVTANKVIVGPGILSVTGSLSTTAGTTVSNGGSLQLNGAIVTGGIALDGGTLRSSFGVNDLSGVPLTITPGVPLSTPDALSGRLYLQTGIGINNDNGINNVLPGLTPANTISLAGQVNIPQSPAADAAFTALFGGTAPGGVAFTAAFLGNYTANATGNHGFGLRLNDDTAVFWVDINRNGIFETAGSAGSELLVNMGCCGGDTLTNVNLVAGETYRVLFGVEDTGGDSGLVANFTQNGALNALIEPGVQPGVWSFDTVTGGGTLSVAGFSSMIVGSVTNGRAVIESGGVLQASQLVDNTGIQITGGFSGGGEGRLILTGSNPSDSTSLTATGGQFSIVEVQNGPLSIERLIINPGGTLFKDGDGILDIASHSIGNGSFLEVRDGLAILAGAPGAANGFANGGGVNVSGTGTARITGTISGSALVTGAGTLGGTGAINGSVIIAGGTIAPGTNDPGTFTLASLALDSTAVSSFKLSTPGTVGSGVNDLIQITGPLTLDGTLHVTELPGFAEGTYRLFNYGGLLIDFGLDLEPAFLAAWPGSSVDTGTTGQVNLIVVPEPGTAAVILTGLGILLTARRRRQS